MKEIGVVFGQRSQLWWDIPFIDSFERHKHIYIIPDKAYEERLSNYTELFQMEEFMNKPVRQLSLGQRMRAEIALALIHDPKILFLDEPTIGLDVVGKHRIREFLKHINQMNQTTILLTTHDLKDIEVICDRILIVNNGSCYFDGTVGELHKNLGQHLDTDDYFWEKKYTMQRPVEKRVKLLQEDLSVYNDVALSCAVCG